MYMAQFLVVHGSGHGFTLVQVDSIWRRQALFSAPPHSPQNHILVLHGTKHDTRVRFSTDHLMMSESQLPPPPPLLQQLPHPQQRCNDIMAGRVFQQQSVRMPSWVSLEPEHSGVTITTPNSVASSTTERHHNYQTHFLKSVSSPATKTSKSPTGSPMKATATASSTSPPHLSFYHTPETILIHLCRTHQWPQVIQRCQSHPHEAVPIPIRCRYQRANNNNSNTLTTTVQTPASTTSFELDFRHHQRQRQQRQPAWEYGIMEQQHHSSPWQEFCLSTTNGSSNGVVNTTTTPESPKALQIFHETALGLACRHDWRTDDSNDHMIPVMQALLLACPSQVDCPQLQARHTPLRDAICNPSCYGNPTIWKLLLKHAQHVDTPDQDGYTPLDHLLMRVHPNNLTCTSEQQEDTLETLQVFLENVPPSSSRHQDFSASSSSSSPTPVSPLIRFLLQGVSPIFSHCTCHHPSLATDVSIDGAATPSLSPPFSLESPLNSSNCNCCSIHFDVTQRLELFLQAIQLLLQHDPELLYRVSSCTKCNVLHVALRNYGNFQPLIQCLLQADTWSQQVEQHDVTLSDSTKSSSSSRPLLPLVLQTNQYGDLPLHVACSVGVPWNVLALLVQETVRQEAKLGHSLPRYTSIVWSVNHSGYTPVDLEWVRHIEAGRGLLTARLFYPLEASGIRKHCRKQDDFYRELLEEAVRHVMQADHPPSHTTQDDTGQAMDCQNCYLDGCDQLSHDGIGSCSLDRKAEVTSTFGLLLHRIILIIQAAFRSTMNSNNLDDNFHHCLLHAVMALCRPCSQHIHAFALPRPMMELFLWMCPHQVMLLDEWGRVPLHYTVAAQPSNTLEQDDLPLPNAASLLNTNSEQQRVTRILENWLFACQSLMQQGPNAAKVADRDGRLPLHMALLSADDDVDIRRQSLNRQVIENDKSKVHHQRVRLMVVQKLVDCYPESIELRDPSTRLFPFQMAAACDEVPLESVYLLLRRSPSLVIAK